MKILILQTAFLGDVVIATSFLKAVKSVFPKSKIDFLVSKGNELVLKNNPDVENIFVFDKKKRKLTSFLKTLKVLKKKKYDIVFSLHSSTTSYLLIFLAKIKKRVGFSRGILQFLLTDKIYFFKNKRRIDKNNDLLKPFTKRSFKPNSKIYPDEKDFSLVNKIGLKKKKYICVAPGSLWQTKRWGGFEDLAKYLIDTHWQVVAVGSKKEEKLKNKGVINLIGKTSILQVAAVIKGAKALFCNDSGLMHIANAVKTDVYAFFGPTVEEIGYFPYRSVDKIFQVDLDCRPCGKHGHKNCPLGHHNCMKKISVKEVIKSFNQNKGEEYE